MRFHPEVAHGYQALAFQPFVAHRGLGRQDSCQVPVSFGTQRGQNRLALARFQGQQVSNIGAGLAPLFPVAHPHPSSKPVVQFDDRTVGVRDAVLAHRSPDILGEFVESAFHRNAPTPTGQSAELVAEVRDGSFRPAQFTGLKSKSKEDAVVGGNDSTFLLVDLQLEPLGQEARNALLDPVAGAGTSDQDYQVVRVAGNAVSPSFQFLFQVIQQDVGQQWRQGSALWGSHRRCLEVLSDPGAGPQVPTDQGQQPLIANPSGHADHQDIVLDRVEELGQIQIDGDAVNGFEVVLYLSKGSVGRASRSEAEARCREGRIEVRPRDLRDGLLDQPIQDHSNPQQPFSPGRPPQIGPLRR